MNPCYHISVKGSQADDPSFRLSHPITQSTRETQPHASLLCYGYSCDPPFITLRPDQPEQATSSPTPYRNLLTFARVPCDHSARHRRRTRKGRKTWQRITQRPFTTPHYGGALGRGSSCGTGTPAGSAEDLRRKFITLFTLRRTTSTTRT